jgi:FkbM family methyltransferase
VTESDLAGLARKTARSLLFFTPGIYRLVHSQLRSELQYRLRLPHERDFRALTLLRRGRSPLVLDVGANIGQSVFTIKGLLPGARVVSFEPNPLNLTALTRLERRFDSVTVCGVGLGAAAGEARLFIPVYRGKAMTALASLDEEEARNWLGPGSVFWFSSERLRIESVTVRIETMDSFQLSPDFIKIDAEGAERDVIEGGLETIRRSRPVIMAESLEAGGVVRDLIDTAGYRLLEFSGGAFRPAWGNTNRFLVPEESEAVQV